MNATPASRVLSASHLRFGWPGQPLFQDLNFDLPTGLSLVTGGDGCGKSTLLRLLAGNLPVDAGTLRLTGRHAAEPGDAAWRQQVFWIDPATDAHDAICARDFWGRLPSQYPTFAADALADLVDGLGLQPHLNKPLYMLSAGSKRKVWLAAAFAAGTPLTLIDQPFAALDGAAIRFVHELLQDVATHSRRAWVIADHQAPTGVPLAFTLFL